MRRKLILISALALVFTLACYIDLGLTPTPQTPQVVTQVIVVTAASPTSVPIQPTMEPPLPPPPEMPSLTPLPTATSVPPTPTFVGIASATLIKNAMCRSGPSQSYEAITSFYAGQVLEIVGRNPDFNNTWWQVVIPGTHSTCWISLVTAQATGNFDDLPIIYPPY